MSDRTNGSVKEMSNPLLGVRSTGSDGGRISAVRARAMAPRRTACSLDAAASCRAACFASEIAARASISSWAGFARRRAMLACARRASASSISARSKARDQPSING
eukprot:scaffold154702_cov27-Tisochrysis_lutea.AAC.5